jgi:hypothetical protein
LHDRRLADASFRKAGFARSQVSGPAIDRIVIPAGAGFFAAKCLFFRVFLRVPERDGEHQLDAVQLVDFR